MAVAGSGPVRRVSAGRWRGSSLAVGGRGAGEQALGGEAAQHAAQAEGQAGPFFGGQPGEDALLA